MVKNLSPIEIFPKDFFCPQSPLPKIPSPQPPRFLLYYCHVPHRVNRLRSVILSVGSLLSGNEEGADISRGAVCRDGLSRTPPRGPCGRLFRGIRLAIPRALEVAAFGCKHRLAYGLYERPSGQQSFTTSLRRSTQSPIPLFADCRAPEPCCIFVVFRDVFVSADATKPRGLKGCADTPRMSYRKLSENGLAKKRRRGRHSSEGGCASFQSRERESRCVGSFRVSSRSDSNAPVPW